MIPVVYKSSKALNRFRESKSGLQTKTDGNTPNITWEQRNNIYAWEHCFIITVTIGVIIKRLP